MARARQEWYRARELERPAFVDTMQKLKEATGHGSYAAFCQSREEDPMQSGASYQEILGSIDRRPIISSDWNLSSLLLVLGITAFGDTTLSAEIQYRGSSALELATVLQHTPKSTVARVVVWTWGDSSNGHPPDLDDIASVLGLGFKLEPGFFAPPRLGPKEEYHSDSVLVLDSLPLILTVASR